MQRLVLSASALALLSGIVLAAPAQAASYTHRSGGGNVVGNGKVTHGERAAIARSQQHLSALKWRARSDGHVSVWERMQVRGAEARHNPLVYRLRHN